ncbi:MAG: hypothetical protein L3K15_04615 [Thermoplasmata archaeon]|nr:hypothetical protein [Thermoplasmata archaeon]
MTAVNANWNLETAANATRAETAPAASRRGGRMRLRLDEAIGGMNVHLDRCAACLVYGNELCDEGTYARDEVEFARAALLRFELRRLRTPIDTTAPRIAAIRAALRPVEL